MDIRERVDEAIAATISTGNSKGEITDAIMEIFVSEGLVEDEEDHCPHSFYKEIDGREKCSYCGLTL